MMCNAIDSLLSVGDLARFLGISRSRVQYLLDAGIIPTPSRRVAGHRLFTQEEAEQAKSIIKERGKKPCSVLILIRLGEGQVGSHWKLRFEQRPPGCSNGRSGTALGIRTHGGE